MWKPIETAPAETLVLVYDSPDMEWAVARYTHEFGWQIETPARWEMIDPPQFWRPLPASPGQECDGRAK